MKNYELKKKILKECLEGQFYGYEISKKLASKGIELEIGRLYIILNELEKEDLITSHWEDSSKGPKKKYYRLTENGELFLKKETLKAIQTIHEEYGTYLMNLKSQKNIFRICATIIVGRNNKGGNITYFTEDQSPMHEKTLSALQDQKPESTIHFVAPEEAQPARKRERTVYLHGEFDNFPLKNGFSAFLIINGFPKKEKMQTSIQEWGRILQDNGRIGIIVPTVVLHNPTDPMSMTEFIEQLEHRTSETYDYEKIIEDMDEFFEDILEKKILHISIIIGKKRSEKKEL